MERQEAKEDEEVVLLKNEFVRKNYVFVGWSLSADPPESDMIYEDQATVKNLTDVNGEEVTLYAVWTKDR